MGEDTMSELPPGFVIDQQSGPPPGFVTAGQTATDTVKGLGTGVVKGGLSLGGMVGDLTDLGSRGIEKATNAVADAVGLEHVHRPEKSVLDAIPTTASLTKRLTDALGHGLYEPQSGYGQAAEKVGEFVPGAALTGLTGGGSLAGNMARYAAAPGLATFAAEKGLPESDYKPYLVAGAGADPGFAAARRLPGGGLVLDRAGLRGRRHGDG